MSEGDKRLVWTADIDVGGTLTDGLFTGGNEIVSVKVDTTPHDLTFCLFDCLTQAATKLDFPNVASFLEVVELIRWSTTITSNVLAELRGPRIGLLISAGNETTLYGNEPCTTVLNRLISERDVIGLNGSASDVDVMNAARALLESGSRRICVSLKGSHGNPDRELAFKRTIDQQYPDHFLGSVPVLAGSDISKSADDRTRTYCALINAYTHGALAATLFKAEDDLRETAGYAGSFLVSHINGGVAGVSKTKAIDTIESGPVLGILAGSTFAKAYGFRDAIAMDIGGTTAKVSVLRNSEPMYRKPADLFGIPVEISLPYLRSIALGGGSVVKSVGDARSPAIQLGPESMGSYPGPACYALGGDQPTLTDALVAAGLINPEYFLGGTKLIDRELARKAIQESIARPLGLSVEGACRTIIGSAFELVANVIAGAHVELKLDFSKFPLFAYGGNGGLFACGVAEKAGLSSVRIFSLGPVFSAFGSSVSDIVHVYERALPAESVTDATAARFRQILDEMKTDAAKDLLGEGIKPHNLSYTIEFEISRDDRHSVSVVVLETALRSAEELKTALTVAVTAAGENQSTPGILELLRVRVRKEMSKPRLTELALQGSDSSDALIGTREVFWGSCSGQAKIYRWESLLPGNRVDGCAILEGVNTTYFVPEDWTMVVDSYGNGDLSRR
ncbi:MAG TPA: hydantoinase/oxoprolinase family protein [Candidatus Acidoferrales bacterium]